MDLMIRNDLGHEMLLVETTAQLGRYQKGTLLRMPRRVAAEVQSCIRLAGIRDILTWKPFMYRGLSRKEALETALADWDVQAVSDALDVTAYLAIDSPAMAARNLAERYKTSFIDRLAMQGKFVGRSNGR